ncbi:MAG: hypothetical protein K2P35_15465 [Lachnospiraceae bacterium]|nr:hypothetical protein [Lachnospiraceae bacterium]
MKKKVMQYKKLWICVLNGVFAVSAAGCGNTNGLREEQNVSVAENTPSAGIQEEMSDKNEATDDTEENTGKAGMLSEEEEVRLLAAKVRHYYGGILSQIIAAWQLPDGELDTSALGNGLGEMSDNRFAVTDIDGDGREELIVSYSNACMAGMFERIYDYDPVSGELKTEFSQFPALTYYDNGIIKAEWSHNQGYGDFWPFTLYRYESESDSYVDVGSVNTWDKKYKEEWDEGQPFPDGLDTDGDGTLYRICKEGEPFSYGYEDFKYDQADYDEWISGFTEGAEEISIDYEPMAYESFADFTTDYLKLIAKEAGKERTDTASDLGLFILNNDDKHFLDASKELLTQRYGMSIEQPDPDFEEYSAALADGKERFSFTALDSGDLSYMGEKVKDVTIFGIYPGISVDGAWEKLKAYGFYASPYGETENCLITGEGFGNVSIWFDAQEGKVTTITVRPFCAFAG